MRAFAFRRLRRRGEPFDPELRKAYFRREYARDGVTDLMHLLTDSLGKVLGCSVVASPTGFALWGWRVRWYEDAILRLTAAKMKREKLTATAGGAGE